MAATEAQLRAINKYNKSHTHQKMVRFFPKDQATWEKVKDLTSGQIIELITKALKQD